ncbi:transcriptional regulator of acetoin/glycerol metabolism [Clostridium saccharoperbutylacetonicum]|uniref:Signal-transduction and transcriptional-control protein Stc n=1 Tax=Clostridium saccharoperbutylacetonicum N1-4(HMT) TaxID=931276 RepID=M1LU13_9CLOT|nr:sigma-54-dependent Fis family transcriptional regulator [Clostridium saccharoperbutylacetonicum]AGF56545.1 signal-transduction and transcriptional-control protein Stc [Clostridium saccharoperbutylacetonicum N1-4(HMT)]NRT62704.1 transcriptional regulator of acetoin/glycerol metabolism [Clostridium saccharoperbutylacetonicum]NSB26055.1 transcriptional regulator of acetoin/glycerol metabolism [Clostridium saccharoperbutylacetonicum]NSB45410.1 transcriptional regulator of acetoin/glycerol metabo
MDNKREVIENSHKRSESYGVIKQSNYSNKILVGEELENKLSENKELIEISKIYIDMVFSAVMDNEFIIVLTDKDGCILYIKGAEENNSKLGVDNLNVGAYMDEQNIGTNAMGTAISEDRCIQITATEHYIEGFHKLTCSAAPIHNTKREIIGTLNLTGRSNMKHPHTLGLVVFGVKAIENEMDKKEVCDILNQTYNYMESVIDNVDKGIMIIGKDGKIVNINELGAEIFDKDKHLLINEQIDYILPDLGNIIDELNDGNNAVIKEIKFKHNSNHKIKLIFKEIKHKESIVGMVVTISTEKEEKDPKNDTGAYFTFNDIIGESAAIANVIINSKIISNSPSTVLIQGESGTGKEILAQAMHNYSLRRGNKFIAINCGAIPANIIESELFGYEDGTFTGAKKGGNPGKFEIASGGTLFLDEIGEMTLDAQVKLLRVLQNDRVTRLGGSKEIPIDVRVIAATNKNLKNEVKKGAFREDLYYRLCVIPITLPPLRERKGDVKMLIDYFLRIKSFSLNKTIPKIDEKLYNDLISYNWPGNIRQLENYIENIVNLDGRLSFDLWEEGESLNKNASEALKQENILIEENFYAKDIINNEEVFNLEELEVGVIRKAIHVYNNNMTQAAKALGISRNTLYLKIKKYNIEMS